MFIRPHSDDTRTCMQDTLHCGLLRDNEFSWSNKYRNAVRFSHYLLNGTDRTNLGHQQLDSALLLYFLIRNSWVSSLKGIFFERIAQRTQQKRCIFTQPLKLEVFSLVLSWNMFVLWLYTPLYHVLMILICFLPKQEALLIRSFNACLSFCYKY